jgi:hypothetical protein
MNACQQIIAEPFESKTVLRVKYPAWVKSAVDLTDVSSFGGTPTRGAGEIGMGQVMRLPLAFTESNSAGRGLPTPGMARDSGSKERRVGC